MAVAFDLLHRCLDVSGICADQRLEAMRVPAAIVVHIAMLGPHELDVDFMILVAARPTGIDDELNVDTFLVHIRDASIDIPIVAVWMRILGPHEMPCGTVFRGRTRLRLAERARHVRTPAANVTIAQAKSFRRRLDARGGPDDRHLARFQIGHQLAHPRGEVLFEGIGTRPDVRISVVDSVAVSHSPPLPARATDRIAFRVHYAAFRRARSEDARRPARSLRTAVQEVLW
jgi:hypothetical protein